jgi:hypothetical protein
MPNPYVGICSNCRGYRSLRSQSAAKCAVPTLSTVENHLNSSMLAAGRECRDSVRERELANGATVSALVTIIRSLIGASVYICVSVTTLTTVPTHAQSAGNIGVRVIAVVGTDRWGVPTRRALRSDRPVSTQAHRITVTNVF